MPRAGATYALDKITCGARVSGFVYRRRSSASFVGCVLRGWVVSFVACIFKDTRGARARPSFVLSLVRHIWLHGYGWFRPSFGVSQVDKRCLVLSFVVSKYAS
jgi:hypothetical protein